ncbi:MAG: hypothetical protein ACYC9J_12225 [Sulfuricaulis sp.]
MPAERCVLGCLLLVSFAAGAANQPPPAPSPKVVVATNQQPPDMALIEFLGSVETDSSSGKDVLNAIDTELLADLPEKPPHENK